MPVVTRLAVCFGLGALLGTLLDGIHLYGDVESYPHPAFGRWAWFVPLEFGTAGVLVGLLIPHLERLVGPQEPPYWPPLVRVAELCLLVAAYVSTVLLADAPLVVTLALVTLLAVRLRFAAVRGDWAYALAAAVAGPAVEAALAATGAFEYADPDIAGIPIWLPALWANGGLLIRRLFVPVVYRSRSSTSPPSVPT
jgi:hypothetical protein